MKNYEMDRLVGEALKSRNPIELAIGFVRYEKLRKLNARQFAELCKKNLKGEFFDGLVDGLD